MNKKFSWLILGLFQGTILQAQIQVTGAIQNPTKIQVDQIKTIKIVRIPIQNHVGIKKQPIPKAKGIPLLTALSGIELTDSNSRHFSRYI